MKQLNNVLMSFRLGNPQWCAKLRMKRVNFDAWSDMFKTNPAKTSIHECLLSFNTKPLNFTTSLGHTTRTARRTMVTTGPSKVAKFSHDSISVQL